MKTLNQPTNPTTPKLTLADLKRKANRKTKYFKLGEVVGVDAPCKNPDKNGSYIRVEIPYSSPRDPSGNWYKWKTPEFTEQGKLIIKNAPYDSQAVYKVDQELKDGHWTWTNITKLEKGSL